MHPANGDAAQHADHECISDALTSMTDSGGLAIQQIARLSYPPHHPVTSFLARTIWNRFLYTSKFELDNLPSTQTGGKHY